MISEKHIESVIAKMQTEGYEDNFALDQPDYWHYLNSENFKSLTEPEHQLLFFINSVIFHSLEDFDFDMEQYEISEEDNWSIREANKSWTDTKNIFFKKYEQEDLLAFVEDMLVAEEGENISEIAEEIIFITSKSFIDLVVKE